MCLVHAACGRVVVVVVVVGGGVCVCVVVVVVVGGGGWLWVGGGCGWVWVGVAGCVCVCVCGNIPIGSFLLEPNMLPNRPIVEVVSGGLALGCRPHYPDDMIALPSIKKVIELMDGWMVGWIAS